MAGLLQLQWYKQGFGQVWHKPTWDAAWLRHEIKCIAYDVRSVCIPMAMPMHSCLYPARWNSMEFCFEKFMLQNCDGKNFTQHLCGTVGGGTFGFSTSSNCFWTFDAQNIKQLSMVLASGEVLCSTICDISAPGIPLSGLMTGKSVLAKSSLHHQETWTWMHQCGRPPNLAQAQQI